MCLRYDRTDKPVITADTGGPREFFHADSKIDFSSVGIDLIDKVRPMPQEIIMQISEVAVLDDHQQLACYGHARKRFN